MNLGLLLTLTEPPAAMEEEFNAWYDEEHLPERLAIPGFRSAQRWVADVAPGQGRYLATYELDSLVRRFTAQNGERIALWELSDPAIDPAAGIVYRLYKP